MHHNHWKHGFVILVICNYLLCSKFINHKSLNFCEVYRTTNLYLNTDFIIINHMMGIKISIVYVCV